MKKTVCMLLAVLLLGASGAMAGTMVPVEESSPFFDLSINLPEGGKLEQEVANDTTLATITLPGATEDSIQYFFTVAFSDLFTGKSLKDLSDEEMDELFRGATAFSEEEGDTTSYAVKDLDDGVRVMVIYDPDVNYSCWALTIENGYFIQMYGMYEDFRDVTKEDIEYCVTLLDAVEIKPL